MTTCRSKIQETYTRTGSSSVLRTITYQYNANNELTKVTDTHSGSTVRYYYNSAGQITGQYTTHGTDSHSFHYLYDDLGRLVTLEENVGAELYATDYTYDEASRVKTVADKLSVTTYTYDDYSRPNKLEVKLRNLPKIEATISYDDSQNAYVSDRVKRWSWGNTTDNFSYSYTYDNNGNIVSETVNGKTTTYEYDSANQLIRENNQAAGKTWVWTYDGAGNIQSKKEYAYTTGTIGSVLDTVTYTYGNANWGDLLTAYDGEGITYDAVGNPMYDGTWTYNWKYGRQLDSMFKTGATWNFTYDANGMRTKRTNGSVTYTYLYNGSQLTQMTRGSVVMRFSYGTDGRPLVISYNDTPYYYITNLQGDVVAIVNSSGTTVVKYVYDAWGRLLSTTGSMASTLGQYNPLRYRGYIYDQETGLYYLQSRYYNPTWGRFLNADVFVSTGQGLLGNNMFAYCNNNPVIHADQTGQIPQVCRVFEPIFYEELIYEIDYSSKGDLYEYWKDPITKKNVWSRHHSTHGNPKKHTNPHDHEWKDDDDGNNKPGPPQPPNPNYTAPAGNSSTNNNSKQIIGDVATVVAVSVIAYVGIKWLIATAMAPATGGGSLVVAAITP